MVLDPFVDRDNYDYSVFYPGTLGLCKWDGHWVGIPMDIWPKVLVYNKTLFDEAGVEYPSKDWNDKDWNWDTLIEKAQALTKVEGNRTTQFGMSNIGPGDRMAFRQFGQSWFPKEDFEPGYATKFVGNTEAFISAMQLMYDMIETWGVAPTPAQSEALQAGAPNLFMTGKIAMGFFFPWNFPSYSEIEAFEWDLAALPYPKWGSFEQERFNFLYPDQYFIMKGCLAPAEAWNLLKFLCSEEGQLVFPTQVGGMPARMSTAETAWVDLRLEESGKPRESIEVVLDAAGVETPSESHAFVHWQEMWEKGIQPFFEQVFLGELTPGQAVVEMEEAVTRVIEETTPE
jgi:multiple sugar transport system substrate-binding protein